MKEIKVGKLGAVVLTKKEYDELTMRIYMLKSFTDAERIMARSLPITDESFKDLYGTLEEQRYVIDRIQSILKES